MARILHNREWYDELGPSSMFESEFEAIFLQYVPQLYPGCVAVQFKKTVSSDEGSARADLALIQTNYLGWWVVEVERSVHSLGSHVLPQVRTLATAAYGRPEAVYLCEKHQELNEERLFDMIRGEQPRVLVVVDRPCEAWKSPLKELGASLAIFQIFRSDRGRYMVRVNGDHPSFFAGEFSLCVPDPTMRSLLRVQKPALLPEGQESSIEIYYEDQLTFWRRIGTADAVYLSPIGRVDIDVRGLYELMFENDTLVLKLTKSLRR